jgi:hypothetical protein
VGCVHYAGEKMAHYMEYPKGALSVLKFCKCWSWSNC